MELDASAAQVLYVKRYEHKIFDASEIPCPSIYFQLYVYYSIFSKKKKIGF